VESTLSTSEHRRTKTFAFGKHRNEMWQLLVTYSILINVIHVTTITDVNKTFSRQNQDHDFFSRDQDHFSCMLYALVQCTYAVNIHTNFLLYPLAYYITYMHSFQSVIGISTIPLCVHACFVLLCCWLRLPTSNKRTCYIMYQQQQYQSF